jgi:hypothetical protein
VLARFLLFEKLVNIVLADAPHAKFRFSTASPTTGLGVLLPVSA